SLSSENGLALQVLTGDLDPETGEPLYRTTVSLPTRNEDEEGNPVAAEFRGRIIAEDITVLKGLEIQGDAQAGEVSRITPGALMQLDNIVEPPALAATLSYAPGTRKWPNLTNQHIEMGWGIGPNSRILTARVRTNSQGTKELSIRHINQNGTLDHEVELGIPFFLIAGFTASGSNAYVLGRWTNSTPWAIFRFNANTGVYAGDTVTVSDWMSTDNGPYWGALSYDIPNDRVVLAFRHFGNNRLGWTKYGPNLGWTGNSWLTTIESNRQMIGWT